MGGGYFQANRVRQGQRASAARARANTKKAAARRAATAARAKPPPSTIVRPQKAAKIKRRTTNSRRAYNSERSARSMARAQRQSEKRQVNYNYGSYGGIRTKPAIKARRKKASMSQKYGRKKLGYSGKKTWHW